MAAGMLASEDDIVLIVRFGIVQVSTSVETSSMRRGAGKVVCQRSLEWSHIGRQDIIMGGVIDLKHGHQKQIWQYCVSIQATPRPAVPYLEVYTWYTIQPVDENQGRNRAKSTRQAGGVQRCRGRASNAKHRR